MEQLCIGIGLNAEIHLLSVADIQQSNMDIQQLVQSQNEILSTTTIINNVKYFQDMEKDHKNNLKWNSFIGICLKCQSIFSVWRTFSSPVMDIQQSILYFRPIIFYSLSHSPSLIPTYIPTSLVLIYHIGFIGLSSLYFILEARL